MDGNLFPYLISKGDEVRVLVRDIEIEI